MSDPEPLNTTNKLAQLEKLLRSEAALSQDDEAALSQDELIRCLDDIRCAASINITAYDEAELTTERTENPVKARYEAIYALFTTGDNPLNLGSPEVLDVIQNQGHEFYNDGTGRSPAALYHFIRSEITAAYLDELVAQLHDFEYGSAEFETFKIEEQAQYYGTLENLAFIADRTSSYREGYNNGVFEVGDLRALEDTLKMDRSIDDHYAPQGGIDIASDLPGANGIHEITKDIGKAHIPDHIMQHIYDDSDIILCSEEILHYDTLCDSSELPIILGYTPYHSNKDATRTPIPLR